MRDGTRGEVDGRKARREEGKQEGGLAFGFLRCIWICLGKSDHASSYKMDEDIKCI